MKKLTGENLGHINHEKFAKDNDWIGTWNDTYLANKLGVDEITKRDKDLIMLFQLKFNGKNKEDITNPDLSDLVDEVFDLEPHI